MRLRLESALTGAAVCAVACALLWPEARDAAALLAARDDPGRLSDLRVHSALRNRPAAVAENIETALATGDADLANSFVALAAANHIAIREDLSTRVAEAVAEESSVSNFAPARWPVTCSCSVTSATWCARASISRWARKPIT
jgi:hypothetical protein